MADKKFTNFFISYLKLHDRFSANNASFFSARTHNMDTLNRVRHEILTASLFCERGIQILPCACKPCLALPYTVTTYLMQKLVKYATDM